VKKMVLATKEEKLKLTNEQRVVTLLDHIWNAMVEREGKTPNIFIREFDLATTARITISADFNPDRWVVWFRPNSAATLRLAPADFVPGEGAIEISNGQRAMLESVGRNLAFHNTGTATAHIFAVAVGGGAAFDIRAA
jgi:hypothetical protein